MGQQGLRGLRVTEDGQHIVEQDPFLREISVLNNKAPQLFQIHFVLQVGFFFDWDNAQG